jgi:hypothetical protein
MITKEVTVEISLRHAGESKIGSERDIPCKYRYGYGKPHGWKDEVPSGLTVCDVSRKELHDAGFFGGKEAKVPRRKPGTAPIDELLAEGLGWMTPSMAETILAETSSIALRNDEGKILATWDEGRWWTPQESDAFIRQLKKELRADAA